MSKFWFLKLVSYSFHGPDQHLNCSAKPIPIKGWLKIFLRYGKSNKKILFSAHSIRDVKLYLSLIKFSTFDHTLLTFRLSSYLFAGINGIKAKTMFHIPLIASIIPTFRNIKNTNFDRYKFYSSLKIKKNYFKKSFFL